MIQHSSVSSVIYRAERYGAWLLRPSIEMILILFLLWSVNYGNSLNNFPSLISANATMGTTNLILRKEISIVILTKNRKTLFRFQNWIATGILSGKEVPSLEIYSSSVKKVGKIETIVLNSGRHWQGFLQQQRGASKHHG